MSGEGSPRVHLAHHADLTFCIAIDSTRRGPALGGCRWRPYASEAMAITEARALARAMTCKATLADLALGGGKAVVIGDPTRRTNEALHAFGDFVESLGGAYITAEDMGTDPQAMSVIAERTRHVAGLPPDQGGCGDPSPHTATGVFLAIEAALAERGRKVPDATIAVQGVGAVGSALVEILLAHGAHVVASDASADRLARLPLVVERVAPDELLFADCDVLAPCGPPGVLDPKAVERLRCGIVCGAANNPLAARDVAQALDERGILFVPDYLANAGGLIHLFVAREGGDARATRRRLDDIPRNFAAVMDRARAVGTDPLTAAEQLIAERLG